MQIIFIQNSIKNINNNFINHYKETCEHFYSFLHSLLAFCISYFYFYSNKLLFLAVTNYFLNLQSLLKLRRRSVTFIFLPFCKHLSIFPFRNSWVKNGFINGWVINFLKVELFSYLVKKFVIGWSFGNY